MAADEWRMLTMKWKRNSNKKKIAVNNNGDDEIEAASAPDQPVLCSTK